MISREREHRPKWPLSLRAVALLMLAVLVSAGLGCTEKSPTALLHEIRSLREEIVSGQVVVDWHPDEHSYLPSDPLKLLDYLERKILSPDLSAYFYQEDLDAQAETLRAEIESWPEVGKVVFVSGEETWGEWKADSDSRGIITTAPASIFPDTLEIHLTDCEDAKEMVSRLSGEPGIQKTSVHDKSGIVADLELVRDSVRSP